MDQEIKINDAILSPDPDMVALCVWLAFRSDDTGTTSQGQVSASLAEIAADPIDHARVKVISGTAREIDWADRLNSVRRNFMLQGLATQGVNLVSPLLYTAEQQLPLVLEATLHHLTGGRVGQMGFPALGRLWGGFG